MKQIHGGDVYRHQNVIDFSANINPLGTPQSIKDAICESMDQIAHYPDIFCTKLINDLSAAEHVDKERLILGNGAAELIFSFAFAKKPRKALLLAPTFLEYEQALRAAGCEISYYELKEEYDFEIQSDLLDDIIPELDVMFLCNPNNPTGVLTKRDRLEQILAACEKNNVMLVLDECFNDFIDEPEVYTMKEHLKTSRNLFILKAFTKLYAVPGVRLGYGMCGDMQLLEAMHEVMQPWNISVMAQAAGVAALKETAYVKESMQLVAEQRKYLKAAMSEIGIKTYASNANYIFFQAEEDLYEKALEAGFLIRDCSNYPALRKGYYRIAVRQQKENEQWIAWMRENTKG